MKIHKPESPKDVELLIYNLLRIIKNLDRPSNFIKFHGFLRKNYSYVKDDEIDEDWEVLMKDKNMLKAASRKEALRKSYYKVLIYIVKKGLQEHPRSTRLWLLLSNMEFSLLNLKWQAVYSINQLFMMKPSLKEQFSAVRTSIQIEREMKNSTLKDIESTGLDLLQTVDLQSKLYSLLGAMEQVVKMQLEFWRELKDDKPNSKKLFKLGTMIISSCIKVERKYRGICSISRMNVECIELYAHFLKYVVNEEKKAMKVLEQLESCKREIQFKQGGHESSKVCLFVVSGNQGNLGKILKVGKEVFDFFGYKPKEILGESIDILMPKHYADNHDEFMRRYFKEENCRVMNKTRTVFGLKRNGCIKSFKLRLKILPDLEKGLRLIALVSESKMFYGSGDQRMEEEDLPEPNYILFDNIDFRILGISESCQDVIGLKPAYFSRSDSHKLDMEMIAPELFSEMSQRCVDKKQVNIEIDTSILFENYQLNQDTDEEYKKIRQKKTKKTSRKPRVTARIRTLRGDSEHHFTSRSKGQAESEVSESEGDIQSSYNEDDEKNERKIQKVFSQRLDLLYEGPDRR